MAEDPSETELAERYRPRLEAEREEIAESSAASGESRRPVELDQQSVGRLSRQDALQNQAMAQAQEARRSGRLRAIAAAVERIEEGEFGFCEDCGDFIGWRRLDLDPCAVRCTDCAR
ncbi:TraR/DksA family transcriptional regulator [Histidinibacterium aquaticum]|uniref:TraR/DksA family transcriptional regulator n=1 Tax=Histidinibacterium aquaticum TaxID=2613962 RepID=A0A5J5GL22_9RHOB|nr:TraR/DksA C4-type zinc finger protein [Histidinibacterium aquaticum]KAA9008328.1 TraR/DksA family transcriptional regulator [Histidinibacterium aquaticum]